MKIWTTQKIKQFKKIIFEKKTKRKTKQNFEELLDLEKMKGENARN